MRVPNVFDQIPAELPHELTEVLASDGDVRVERIVSRGHCSPPDYWYDQSENEWVILLSGRARLRFEDEESAVDLVAGDFVAIGAHRRHRVEWTDPRRDTVWLAIFYP